MFTDKPCLRLARKGYCSDTCPRNASHEWHFKLLQNQARCRFTKNCIKRPNCPYIHDDSEFAQRIAPYSEFSKWRIQSTNRSKRRRLDAPLSWSSSDEDSDGDNMSECSSESASDDNFIDSGDEIELDQKLPLFEQMSYCLQRLGDKREKEIQAAAEAERLKKIQQEEEKRQRLAAAKVKSAADQAAEGTAHFKRKEYNFAVSKYSMALRTLDDMSSVLRISVLYNRASAYFELKRDKLALEDCSAILAFDDLHFKSLRLQGRIAIRQKDYATAMKRFKVALALSEDKDKATHAKLLDELRFAKELLRLATQRETERLEREARAKKEAEEREKLNHLKAKEKKERQGWELWKQRSILDILGVAPSVDDKGIKIAFHKALLRFHPDRAVTADGNTRVTQALLALKDNLFRENWRRKNGRQPLRTLYELRSI